MGTLRMEQRMMAALITLGTFAITFGVVFFATEWAFRKVENARRNDQSTVD